MHNINFASSVESVIRQAGQILLYFFHKKLTWKDKKERGFVTEADLASEEFLIKELGKLRPEASFFAEESGAQGLAGTQCWIIDPLDGTTNFAFGIPHFCISVALTENNLPIFGMIYLPLSDELFYAEQGKGAYLNGNPINVAHDRPLNRSLLLVGFPYAKGEAFLSVLRHLDKISPSTYAFRHLGAIAIDQAFIACGRADGLFFEDLAWWDVAAGLLLIKEAGGVVTTYSGKEITPEYHTYLAANPVLHKKLLSFFNDQNVKID